ncbi:MAG: anthranilate synthase component I, partial [Candidatus Omnitrophota bacterium]
MDNTLSFHPASLREFRKLAARGNVVPVYAEVNADLDTPVSAFLKIRKGRYSFLLESVEGQEKIARYSFLGTDPRVVFKSKDGAARLCGRGVSGGVRRFRAETGRGPLDELKKL